MFYCFQKLSEFEVLNLEKKLDFKFSYSYKSFLLNYGGIYIDHQNYATFSVEFLDDSLVEILKIFKPEELIEINNEYLPEIKDFLDCIIIAEDPGGNFFLLDNFGKIYYWDRTLIHVHISDFNRKIPVILNGDDSCEEVAIYFLFPEFDDFFAILEKASMEQKSPFTFKGI
ncbi:SMI1/KNR4 family protein [Capnocytophaga sp.]|uniref:SMI1/KNR4 family protein n=1 Tax=Capnocytophaga sp. TaxID=44737 RepID=UPI0026DD8221|nr:SMI1/KNR4 family protein [Capnocytophaga sp.]MDO5106081.1 SMI1/KNR4 family protein [Capnocytophaga sp.]